MFKKIRKRNWAIAIIIALIFNMIPVNIEWNGNSYSNTLTVKADNANLYTNLDVFFTVTGSNSSSGVDIGGVNGLEDFVGYDNQSVEVSGLKYDVSSIPDNAVITSATLFIEINTITGGDALLDLYGLDNDGWNDVSIPTYYETNRIGLQETITTPGIKSFDVKAFVQNQLVDNGASFIFAGNNDTTNHPGDIQDFSFTCTANTDGAKTKPHLSIDYYIPPQLTKVTSVSLSNEGVASWGDVDNESGYSVQLYKDGIATGVAETKSADELGHDFLSAMRTAGTGNYTVTVTAIGDKINHSDSDASDASSAQSIVKPPTVSAGLTWTGDVAHWTGVANAVSYDVQLYKGGSAVGAVQNVLAADIALGADFTSEITSNGPGTYTYNVTAKGDSNLILDSSQSVVSNDNVNVVQLTKVTGATLSSSGVATWTNVSNASKYIIEVFKDDTSLGTAEFTNGASILPAMRSAGAGVYKFKITAKGDGTLYSDALQSDESTSQSIIQLATVSSGLNWTGDVAHWNTVAGAINYDVQLYKDGSPVGTLKNVLAANVASGADFASEIAAEVYGSFTYKVTAKGDGVLLLDSAQSAASDTKLIATPLAQVTGTDLSSLGDASWNALPNAVSYTVKLYKGGIYTGDSIETASTSINVLSNMRAKGVGIYTVKVAAIGDVVNYSDGPESNASASQTIAKLSTATGLTWAGDVAHWSTVTNAVSYDVQLYKNGSAVAGALENVLEANRVTGVDFSSQIASNGGGTYTFKVTAKCNSGLSVDADSSAASTDNIKAIQLAQVTNVALSSSGVASWDNVSNESNYSVQLYKDGSVLGSAILKNADDLNHNFLSAMRTGGEGTYTVKVTAIGDGIYYTDGLQSVVLSNRTISKLTTATSLTWTGNIAHFLAVTNASSYEVQLYKGGSIVTGAVKTVTSGALSAGADFATEIACEGAGTYTFKVTAKGDGILILDGEESLPSIVKIVASPLAQVTGVALSFAGVASWNNVSNETNYSVQLFKNGNPLGSAVFKNADELSHNFISIMRSSGAGIYTVKVTAVGDTINYSDSLQSAASSGQTVKKLATVSGLNWLGDTAKFTVVSDAVDYEVQLYKNGNTLGSLKTITAANASLGADFSSEIATAGVGSYSFKITAKGDANLILDSETSSASAEHINSIQLAQVIGVTLSDTGVATWTNLDNETNYSVQLYKDGVAYGSPSLKNANVVSHDFLSKMRTAGAGTYSVKVTAKGDSVYYLDGLQSAASSGKSVVKLSTVSGLNWVGDTAKFTVVTDAVNYEVQLYKNGNTLGLVKTITAANASLGADFSSEIATAGVGIYSFKVLAKGDANLILDAETSSTSTEKLKTLHLAQVTGVTLSDTGVVSWTDVANENNYEIQLYKDGITFGSPIQVSANVVSQDFLTTMRAAGAGTYSVKVTAKGVSAFYVDGEASLASATQIITKPATVANGLKWSNTLAKWSPTANAVSYEVQLYKNGIATGPPVSVLASNADNGVDFNSSIILSGFGTYTYKVTAKGNTTLILDAEQSATSNDYVKNAEQSNVTFDKNDNSKNNKKISVELSLDSSILTSIKKGSNKLKAKEDYSIANNVLIISKNYLESLGGGSSTLTILYNNGDKQTIVIKVVDTTKKTTSESTTDSTTETTSTVTNTTQTQSNAPSTENSTEENNEGNTSNENLNQVENNNTDSDNSQQGTEESANQQNSGSFEVETETTENTPTFTMSSEEELYDAVLTEEEKAAIAAGEKVAIKVVVEAIEEPEDGDVVRENLGENTFGMFFDISILKTIGTQQSEVHDLNQPITLTFDIPDELKGQGKYSIIRVHNGEYVVLEDEDDNPDTVTFSTDRFSTYALIYEGVDESTSALVNVAETKDNSIIFWIIAVAIVLAGGVGIVLKKRHKVN